MCGRFVITSKQEILERRFDAKFEDGDFKPRYNAAPSQQLPVILNTNPRAIVSLRWGLMPPWAKKIGRKDGLINVRSETLRDKKTFTHDFVEHRCLILSDGFYEWSKRGASKMPFLFRLTDSAPFAFAGIYEENKDEEGRVLQTFAIITTTPNALVAKYHDRMPVILPEGKENEWLETESKEAALSLLKPLPARTLDVRPVSLKVNNARVDEPSLLKAA
jgi:putative SOS response-associated peptidase YedK